MERRVTSHTEEEEMNQRRRLLTLARKGDQKAVDQLFELYQVKVFSGDSLKRKKLPTFPLQKPTNMVPKGSYAPEKKEEKTAVKKNVMSAKQNKISHLKKKESKPFAMDKTGKSRKEQVLKPGKGKAERSRTTKSIGKAKPKPKASTRSTRNKNVLKSVKAKSQKSVPTQKGKIQKKIAKKK